MYSLYKSSPKWPDMCRVWSIYLTHSPTRSVSVTSSTAFDNRPLIVHVHRRTQLETPVLSSHAFKFWTSLPTLLCHIGEVAWNTGALWEQPACADMSATKAEIRRHLRRKFWFSPVDSDNIISSCLGPSSFAPYTQNSFSVRLPGFNNIAISYPSSAWRYINGVYNVVYLNIWLWLSQPSTVLSESMTFRRRKMR